MGRFGSHNHGKRKPPGFEPGGSSSPLSRESPQNLSGSQQGESDHRQERSQKAFAASRRTATCVGQRSGSSPSPGPGTSRAAGT